MYCSRTGLPTDLASSAASMAASPASLRPYEPGPGTQMGAHFLRRQAENAGDAVTGEMRLLRTGPQRDLIVFDLDHGAGGTHAGMRLEWPFVLGLDDTGRAFERFIDIASLRARDFLLAYRGLAEVLVERSLIRKWRGCIGPCHLELLRRLDRVPFLVGDDAEKALVPNHARAGNVLD